MDSRRQGSLAIRLIGSRVEETLFGGAYGFREPSKTGIVQDKMLGNRTLAETFADRGNVYGVEKPVPCGNRHRGNRRSVAGRSLSETRIPSLVNGLPASLLAHYSATVAVTGQMQKGVWLNRERRKWIEAQFRVKGEPLAWVWDISRTDWIPVASCGRQHQGGENATAERRPRAQLSGSIG